MYGWRGLLTGALALIVVSVVVTPEGSTRVGGAFDAITGIARRFLDPTVPAIPERTEAPTVVPGGAGLGAVGNIVGGIVAGGGSHPADAPTPGKKGPQ